MGQDRFRFIWLLLTAFLWVFTLWVATHHSENREILGRFSASYAAFLAALLVMSLLAASANFGAAYRWLHGKRANLALFTGSLVFSFVILEVSVRVLDPLGISYYQHAKTYHLDKDADPELYYKHKPHLDKWYQGVRVTTNSLGMRDAEIGVKEPGEKRILFLGDSVTFGWGVAQQDIFAHKVGAMLQEMSNNKITPVNSGVGSYNTQNELAVLNRYGSELDPDLVVLMYVSNDLNPTPPGSFDPWSAERFDDKSPPQTLKMLLGRSWSYRLLIHLMKFGKGQANIQFDPAGTGWRVSSQALSGISDYCKQREIPFLVLMYRIVPLEHENAIAREIDMLSREQNFHYADVLPWFKDKDIHPLINSIVDAHPNAEGHTILARGIVDSLARNKLLTGIVSD